MAHAFEQPWNSITLIPAVDLTEKRYYAVKVDANGKAVLAGAGEKIVGVVQEPNNVDQPAHICVHGVSFVKLGATVASGAEVEVNADSKFITLASGKSAGICLEGGSVDDLGAVLLSI